MKQIAEALEISRSHLIKILKEKEESAQIFLERRTPKTRLISDKKLTSALQDITRNRPTYGYRRATAVLNRRLAEKGEELVNHKRVYRIMKQNKLLLPKHIGFQPEKKHEGKVITLKSNTRWCSDSLQIRCWDDRLLEMVFLMDTCDREIVSFVAKIGYLKETDVQDMLIMGLENRFCKAMQAPFCIEWLTDNGKIFTSKKTQDMAKEMNFIPCQTPVYSPESNGMSEAFVKRFKQDYFYINDLWEAEEVVKKIPQWIEDYNENHPHKGLKMKSPREFLKLCANN
jgi:putative transposase